MLIANKVPSYFSLLFLLFFTPAYALDISNFDIKGIKLGMKKDMVFKKMPCSNPKSDSYKADNGKITTDILRCGSNKYSSEPVFSVYFDHNGYVYTVGKRIPFSTKPDLTKIKNKLINKYGQPNAITNLTPGYKNPNTGFIKTFCWGDCEIRILNDGHWNGRGIKNYSDSFRLEVTYRNVYIDSNHSHYLSFQFEDPKRERKNNHWEDNENKKFRIQQREKASNIDF